ncbi:MAG TPA: LacI family DNA-binding transcriptional regulator [Aggregatilineaceae bacterium]|jgi:DNA-binding LacI/PurR family transcriptional regulator|nr:LacI family transcriptional regulator [Anaerolineae bacterium]HMM27667.1 LacI family DNA-binding transcriptional regulator [Aggregatilineaceae bacterium]
MTRKRVTQADVAQRAGVSQAAVSQILGGQPKEVAAFRDTTRQKVLQAAQELGYAPSMLARALRTNRTMTIGVILRWITDELSLRVARGIQSVAHERGYNILIGDTEQDAELETQLLERFDQHQVDGLIFIDSWSDRDFVHDDDNYPPSIFVNLRNGVGPRNCIAVDHVRAGYEATRHLLDLGYRPVAHISGPSDWPAAMDRLEGYRRALEDYGIAFDADLVETGDWEMEAGLSAADRLLDRSPRLRAIFCANDLIAAGALHTAMRRGRRVPQDLALVGYDDRRFARYLYPSLTSFALPLNMMGQKAAHLLIDGLLTPGETTVPSIMVPGALSVRSSCGSLATPGRIP